MNQKVFRLLLMIVLCCPVLQLDAQSRRVTVGETRFSFKGKRILDKDSVQQGSTLDVDVIWNKEHIKKYVFDSACVVYKLSPKEQKLTGKTEKLVRDTTFVPREPTPEELKNCKFSFKVKPKRTTLYFYTMYISSGSKIPTHERIKVVDKKGNEIK